MKTKSNFQYSVAITFLSTVLLACALGTGCAGKTSKTKTEPAGGASPSAAATSPASTSSVAKGIPARPEQLPFPPLTYEPPAPEKFRVALKSGPIAYVVADHELPLVNIAVSVHTGQYLEPE